MRKFVFCILLLTVTTRRTRRKEGELDYQDQLNRLTERVLALEEEVKTLKTTNAGLHEIVEGKEAVDDIEFLLTKNEELTGRPPQDVNVLAVLNFQIPCFRPGFYLRCLLFKHEGHGRKLGCPR